MLPNIWFIFKVIAVIVCYINCLFSIILEFCLNCRDSWIKIVNERKARSKKKLKQINYEEHQDSEIEETLKTSNAKKNNEQEIKESKTKMTTRKSQAGVFPNCNQFYKKLSIHLPSCCAKIKKA